MVTSMIKHIIVPLCFFITIFIVFMDFQTFRLFDVFISVTTDTFSKLLEVALAHDLGFLSTKIYVQQDETVVLNLVYLLVFYSFFAVPPSLVYVSCFLQSIKCKKFTKQIASVNKGKQKVLDELLFLPFCFT